MAESDAFSGIYATTSRIEHWMSQLGTGGSGYQDRLPDDWSSVSGAGAEPASSLKSVFDGSGGGSVGGASGEVFSLVSDDPTSLAKGGSERGALASVTSAASTRHPPPTGEVACEPMRVRLASIKSPAEFWCMQLPPPGETVDPKSPLGRVLKLEAKLDEMYGQETKAKGQALTEAKKGMLVAARLGYGCHWHRARIVDVIHKAKLVTVRVFLVDYGNYSDEIPFEVAVRKLPSKMSIVPKPLAFLVILQGLRTLSWEMNFEASDEIIHEIATTRWSEATMRTVMAIWGAAPAHRTAIVTNYKWDEMKRCHGIIDLQGFSLKVCLNQILVRSGHAKYFHEAFLADTRSATAAAAAASLEGTVAGESFMGIKPMPKNLSICGSGIERGTISIDESIDFTQKDFEMMDYMPPSSTDLSFTTNTSETGSRCGTDKLDLPPLRFLDPDTGKKPNTYNKMSRSMTKRFLRSTPLDTSLNTSRSESVCGDAAAAAAAAAEVDDAGSNAAAAAASEQSFVIGGGRGGGGEASGGLKKGRHLLDLLKSRRKLDVSASSSLAFTDAMERSRLHSTIWESFRENSSDDEEDSCSEEEGENGAVLVDQESRRKKRQERRHQKALLNKSKIMMLPAGVDTGKFLEAQLRRVHNEGIGPKKVIDLLDAAAAAAAAANRNNLSSNNSGT